MRPSDRSRQPRGLPHHLETQVSYRLNVPLIYVKGELDHDSSAHLRPVLEEELSSTPDALVLDFTELSYMDSGGLSLMFDLVQRFEPPRWVGVVGPNAGIERLLQMTGLADSQAFRLFPDLKAVAKEVGKAES